MAPLPPSSTKRWFLDYNTCGSDHTLLCRSVDLGTAAGASAAIGAFLTAIDSQIYELTVTGFRVAAVDSNVTLPATWGGELTYGSDDGPRDHGAAYVDFVARSEAGKRCRVAVFGGKNYSVGEDFRVSDADSTVVGDAIDALLLDSDYFEAIDGLPVVWNRYFNIGTNAYWRNKIR